MSDGFAGAAGVFAGLAIITAFGVPYTSLDLAVMAGICLLSMLIICAVESK